VRGGSKARGRGIANANNLKNAGGGKREGGDQKSQDFRAAAMRREITSANKTRGLRTGWFLSKGGARRPPRKGKTEWRCGANQEKIITGLETGQRKNARVKLDPIRNARGINTSYAEPLGHEEKWGTDVSGAQWAKLFPSKTGKHEGETPGERERLMGGRSNAVSVCGVQPVRGNLVSKGISSAKKECGGRLSKQDVQLQRGRSSKKQNKRVPRLRTPERPSPR